MEAQGIPKTEQGAIKNDSTSQSTLDGDSRGNSGRAVVSSNSDRGNFRLSNPSLLADSGDESEAINGESNQEETQRTIPTDSDQILASSASSHSLRMGSGGLSGLADDPNSRRAEVENDENDTPQSTAGASILPGNRADLFVASDAPGMGNDLANDRKSGGRSEAKTVDDAHVPCTRARNDSTITKQAGWTGRQLVEWAIGNYALDPVQNSKNRWRIRIRCRKVGCVHSDHIALKTISFMDDSLYRRIARSERKYGQWKKQIIAENAGTLRQGD